MSRLNGGQKFIEVILFFSLKIVTTNLKYPFLEFRYLRKIPKTFFKIFHPLHLTPKFYRQLKFTKTTSPSNV